MNHMILTKTFLRCAHWMPLYVAICVSGSLFAQSNPTAKQIIPPSPNVAAFAKYGDIPVSTYTGVPNISIPIYEIKVRDITVPISLSYHASGIRVSEEAGRVGLGWTLNSGGVISRNVIGWDDFFVDPRAYVNTNNTQLPLGPLYAPLQNIQGGTIPKFINTLNANISQVDLTEEVYGNDVDFEPDVFNYNFIDKSGKFVLLRDGSAIIEKQEKIKITPINNGASWEVISSDGSKYIFAKQESSVQPGVGQQVSAWYLTEITSPQGEQVTFNYTDIPSQFVKPVGQFQEMLPANQFSCSEFVCAPVNSIYAEMPVTHYYNVYLSSIVWKNGKVEFEMDGRDDVEGDLRVKAITIFEGRPGQYTQLNKFTFQYNYFDNPIVQNGFPMPSASPGYLTKRLKLSALINTSSTGKELKHQFTYYDIAYEHQLPNKNSFARDHWGYYNGRTQNTSLIPTFKHITLPGSLEEIAGIMGIERNASPTHAMAYSLKDITYPTGGKTSLFYESNDFDIEPGQGGTAPEIYQDIFFTPPYNASTHQLDGDTLDFTDEYVSPGGSTIPMDLSVAFVGNDPCVEVPSPDQVYFEVVSLDGATQYHRVSLSRQACSTPNEIDCLYCDPAQTTYGAKVYKGFITLQPGKYKWRAFAHSGQNSVQTISASFTWWIDATKRSPLGENVRYAIGGGIRLQKIENHDPVTNLTNVRKFEYHYTADTDEDGEDEIHSYGKRMVQPRYDYIEHRWEKRIITGPGGITSEPVCYDCMYVLRQSDSYMPVTGSLGYPVGYTQVTEINGLNGGNGKTVYEYENESDAILSSRSPYQNAYYLKPALVSTRPNPLNGSLLQQSVYSNQDVLLQRTVNVYEEKFEKTVFGISNRRIPAINFDLGDHGVADALFGTDRSIVLLAIYPALRSAYAYLKSTTITNYDGATSISRNSSFSYENEAHLQLSKAVVETSDGTKTVTTYTYPADYTIFQADAAILSMQGTKHIHDKPIQTVVLKEKVDGSKTVLDSEITIYQEVNGRISPKESIKLNQATPITFTQFPTYIPASGYNQEIYYKAIDLGYGGDGNINRVQKPNDSPTAYIWGYDNTLPIAEVKNSPTSQIFHTSFEDDGSLFQDTNGASLARTGDKVLQSSSYTFPSAYAPTESNTVMSYWFWQNGKWIFSGIIPFGRTINSGGERLDEVRAYPQNAQMTTFSYKPLYGISSATDYNNITTYYQYDEFGRLKIIRDEKGNILKRYKYHYALESQTEQ